MSDEDAALHAPRPHLRRVPMLNRSSNALWRMHSAENQRLLGFVDPVLASIAVVVAVQASTDAPPARAQGEPRSGTSIFHALPALALDTVFRPNVPHARVPDAP